MSLNDIHQRFKTWWLVLAQGRVGMTSLTLVYVIVEILCVTVCMLYSFYLLAGHHGKITVNERNNTIFNYIMLGGTDCCGPSKSTVVGVVPILSVSVGRGLM